ncbi:MAG: hypothetical protein U0Z75_07395 [Deinococcaceae bacterium]
MQSVQDVVRCSWVPGTLNRIRLQHNDSETREISLECLERVLGRPATFDLYLKGYIWLNLKQEILSQLIS